jgi:antitoxin (DNA-binding transcriptional repressor) of toxin-antitoxin stability system
VEPIGAYEAKTHLPRLLDEVASAGKTFVITKHGQAVAQLGPVGRPGPPPAEAIAALRAARRGVRLDGLSIREMIEEGRR